VYAYVCMHTCVCIHALAPDMCYAPTHVLLQVETACLEGTVTLTLTLTLTYRWRLRAWREP
jgi:hypothetical protein